VQLVFKALSESKGGETYISKIPSFRITDLANAMQPEAKIIEIGIREGEKLHEVMITRDDSRTTYEYDKHFIIYPNFEWWDVKQNFTEGGKLVKEGFEYNSETNAEWLNAEEIKKALLEI
jgi:FlaA1/EpsC-like NDP-sugar epimerase